MKTGYPRLARGATMAVGLIMLLLITVMLLAAVNLASTNFRAVGNMQFRDEALVAANAAIQERAGSSFNTVPATTVSAVDINNDGQADYTVSVTPACVGATQVFSAAPSSVSLGAAMSASPVWNTVWDIRAAVNDPTSGAVVSVRQGVRVQLDDADRNVACP